MKFELGDHLKDQISGFMGVCTSRADYITGCTQYKLQPKGLNKEKLPWKAEWFDEEELVKTSVKKFVFERPVYKSSGPQDTPERKL